MNITPIPALTDNYIWLIHTQKNEAWVVDPGEADGVIAYLEHHQMTLTGILVTHHHWDHTNGVEPLVEIYDCPVYRGEVPPGFQVIPIPGHTLDHVAYYAPNILFCGDTLFAAGCGRVFEGTNVQMLASLKRLAALPSDTHIYCGHEYTLTNLYFAATIEPQNEAIQTRLALVKRLRANLQVTLPALMNDEHQTNPFLRCHLPAMQAAVSEKLGQQVTSELEVFTALRSLKDQFVNSITE